MFRESAAPGSKHVFAMVTPGKGVNLQYRAATGGQSASAASVAGLCPGGMFADHSKRNASIGSRSAACRAG
jgi:hypothetical protein